MNKILFMTLFLTVGLTLQTAQASNDRIIEIPLGRISYYIGGFSTVERQLKAKIVEAALATCQGLENVAFIGEVNISFHLSALDLYNQDSSVISGSYPRTGATVAVHCKVDPTPPRRNCDYGKCDPDFGGL